MKSINTNIYLGDCLDILSDFDANSYDLILTSPPYADRRSNTYGGIKPDEYVDWFLPRSEAFFKVLKSSGTFILNIKEKAVNGERHTYVIELILAMKKQGWIWTEEFVWHKKTAILANGLIGLGTLGRDVCNSINPRSSTCIKTLSWCRWGIGQKSG